MLDFVLHFLRTPYVVALPCLELLGGLFSVHIQVHLILQHDIDLVFELGDARHVIFHLRIPTGFLKDQICCILSD
jgi:hypothetical protein